MTQDTLFEALGLDTIEAAPYVDTDGNRQAILWKQENEDDDTDPIGAD